jgi:cytoskeleton protein RodZ
MDRKVVEENSEEQIEQAPAVSGIGATLQAARGRTGKSLPEVASLLRIRQPYLQALEEGRHRDLPGGTYAIGFLRTYADFLGLDGEEMVRRFRQEAAGDLNSRSELIFPSPVSEGRVPGGAVIFIGLVAAALIYGGWYWLSSKDNQSADSVPSLPQRLTSLLHGTPAPGANSAKAPVAEPVVKPDETPAAKAETAPGADAKTAPAEAAPMAAKETEIVPPAEDEAKPKTEPAPTTAKVTDPKQAEQKTAPAKAVDQKPAEPVKPAESEAPKPVAEAAKPAESPSEPLHVATRDQMASRVTLAAEGDDCWIQVREMDGQLLVSRLMRKGDTYAVPDRPGLTLMVGNAGALSITVDGKKAPSLGAMGLVRRDIRLDPDKILGGG